MSYQQEIVGGYFLRTLCVYVARGTKCQIILILLWRWRLVMLHCMSINQTWS